MYITIYTYLKNIRKYILYTVQKDGFNNSFKIKCIIHIAYSVTYLEKRNLTLFDFKYLKSVSFGGLVLCLKYIDTIISNKWFEEVSLDALVC